MSLEKSKSIEAGLQSILTEPPENVSERKNISMCRKIQLIFTNITVEPILVCYVLPSVMAGLATQNLTLEKACRVNLKLDSEICDGLSTRNRSMFNETHEQQVQTLVSTMSAWKNVIQSILPAMLLLFLGSWSDRHQRRKPCVIAPIIGEMITCVGFLLCTYFFFELRMEYNAFFEAVPPAITGGWFAMFMGVFSYITGITNAESRTLRIGAVNMFSNVSITMGIALSGVLYKFIGCYGVFSLALAMYTFSIFYATIRVKELPRDPKSDKDIIQEEETSSKPKKNLLLDFFDFRHVYGTFEVAFKNGARNRKRRICTIMVLVMLIIGPMHGEFNVLYMFVRLKFGWNEIDYSLYSTYHFILHTLGTIFSLVFFTKILKVDDAVLGMISSSSKILASIVYTFAPDPIIFCIGPIVECLNGTSFIAMRSIISKLVPSDEIGKINSLFGVCEALMPLVYGPLYSFTYNYTINTLPSAFFLLGGILTSPAVFIFFWLYLEHKRDQAEDKKNARERGILLAQKNIEVS